MQPMNQKLKTQNRFATGQDLVITPLVSTAITVTAIVGNYIIHRFHSMNSLSHVVIFFILQTFFSLFAIKIIRSVFPAKEGIFPISGTSRDGYLYKLESFICITHLSLFYTNALISPMLRKSFYKILGARMGNGFIPIGGRLGNPLDLITLEEGVVIGEEALLLPHAQSSSPSSPMVVLGKIRIGKGAVVGAKSVLMPGVTIGEAAVVNAMSLVPMNTKIGPYEIWGGNPAKKIGEIKKLEGLTETAQDEKIQIGDFPRSHFSL